MGTPAETDGAAPLTAAAMHGKNDFATLLMEADADVNAVDNKQHGAPELRSG